MTLVANAQYDQLAAVDLISVPDASRRIGVHPDTLYRLCRTGQFPPAVQIGSRWRVSVPKLERFLHGDEIER
jgi:excisionase family DNA binding protein